MSLQAETLDRRSLEAHLLQVINRPDAVASHLAIDALVRSVCPLIVQIAKKYRGQGIELDDLIQVGLIAVAKAARTYNSDHGTSFVSWATSKATYAMKDEIREQASLITYSVAASKKLLKSKEFHQMRREVRSLDYSRECYGLGGAKPRLLHDILESPRPVDLVDREAVRGAVRQLHSTARRAVELRFGMQGREQGDMTMREVAEVMGITESRVSQILALALPTIKAVLLLREGGHGCSTRDN